MLHGLFCPALSTRLHSTEQKTDEHVGRLIPFLAYRCWSHWSLKPGISHSKPSDLDIHSPVMSLTRMVAGFVSTSDEVPYSMEVKGTFVRSDARRSRIHPPIHPGDPQSIDHSMSVLFLKCMDHALYLSAPLPPSVHQNRWEFNVLEGIRQHVTPIPSHSQP